LGEVAELASPLTYLRPLAQIPQASGDRGWVSRNAITQYLSPSDWSQLGTDALWDLDTISEALGVSVPRRDAPARRLHQELRGTWRVALICELAGIPSPRFYIEVLRSLVEARPARNLSVVIHAVQPSAADFHTSLHRMIRFELPEGVNWFRITPDARSLEILNGVPDLRPRVPAVVVHGGGMDTSIIRMKHSRTMDENLN